KERSEKHPAIGNALNTIFSSETLLQVIEKQEEIFLDQAVQTHELSYQLEKSKRKLVNTTPTTSEATCSVKISFVVITYNMQREAERTLRSLTKEYQEGVEGLNYEVIVIDNGSSEPLKKETIEAIGENFRYYYLEDAPESPAHAINFGATKATGEFLAIMIDGAHILSPGVIHYASRAIAQYEEPIIAVQYWYLGPGPQNITTTNGYNRDVEDELIKSIDWPNNGYGLYSISEKIPKNNSWLEALFESNCLFLRKRLFDAIGGANEDFAFPGGGFLNADIYKEAAESGGVQVVTILGEGSFHQVHGGTTTNVPPEELDSLIRAYRDQYKKIRGHEYQMAHTQIQYIGHMPREARKPGSAMYHLKEKYNPSA
ncbi:MAG: glycosyltransferase family 2 protein, partial [Proteobacteria bacterium]|nr:glycosyltransferase family 2 protein [Pseudomonadota bacterium]